MTDAASRAMLPAHCGRSLTLFVDEFRTPVAARSAADGVLMALETSDGILHLGGRERVSRYDLGIILAEMLGADPGLILPGHKRDRTVGAPRPPDVSLDSSRAYALGYDPPPLREELAVLLRLRGIPNRADGVSGEEPGASQD